MHTAAKASNIINVDYETFDKDVIEESYNRLVIVDLWADWCPPCLMIAPVLEKLAHDYGDKLLLVKVEVDEGHNMKIAGQNQVRGFPTILFYQQGEVTQRFSGAKPRHFVVELIDKCLLG